MAARGELVELVLHLVGDSMREQLSDAFVDCIGPRIPACRGRKTEPAGACVRWAAARRLGPYWPAAGTQTEL